MVSRLGDAIAAYRSAAARAEGPGVAGREDGPSFGELLREAGRSVVEDQRQAEAVSASAVLGKANLTDVVTAVSHAELSLQTAVAVRDKIIAAYQDILRMPI